MTQTSVVLHCFTSSISKAFEVNSDQSTYFVANSSQLIKTLVVLGGKEPHRVVKLYEILITQLDTILSKGTKDPIEQETMEGMMGALTFGIGSKKEEIYKAACLFFEGLFHKITQMPDKLYVKMFLSKILLLDQTLLQSVKKTLMINPERAHQVNRIFDSQLIAEILAQDLEAIFNTDHENVVSTLRFYLHFAQCTSPELMATVCSRVLLKYSQPQVDQRIVDRLTIFFIEAEALYANTKGSNVIGCTDAVAHQIIERCLTIISGKGSHRLEACRCLNSCISLAVGATNEEKSLPDGLSPKRKPYIRKEVFTRLPQILDSSFSNPSPIVRSFVFKVASIERFPPLIIYQIFLGVKKFNFRTKARSTDLVDSNLLGFYKACVEHSVEIGAASRQILFDLLVEITSHNYFFREACILLLALTSKISMNDGDNGESYIKTIKNLSKDLVQVKYHNMVHHPDEQVEYQVSIKIFKVSVHMKIVLMIVKAFKPENESKRSLISAFKRINECTYGLALAHDVREILFYLGAAELLEKPSAPKTLPRERAKSNTINKTNTIRPIAAKLTTEASLDEHRVVSAKNRPPTPHNSKPGLERVLQDHFKEYQTKRGFSATDYKPSIDNSMTLLSYADSENHRAAKMRVANVLAKSDALVPIEPIPDDLELDPDQSLARQVKDWKEIPLIEKSKFLVAKKEVKEKERYNTYAYTFKPETNPHKEDHFIQELSTHDPIYSVHDPIHYPFDPTLETEEELNKVTTHIRGNRAFLKRLFLHSLSFKKVKTADATMLPLTTFNYLMSGLLIPAEACRVVLNRVKLQSPKLTDKSSMDFTEFEHMLIQIADYLARSSFSKGNQLSAALVQIFNHLLKTFGDKIPFQKGGDPEVEEYFQKKQPEILPKVR